MGPYLLPNNYTHDAFHGICGQTLRPGGYILTARAFDFCKLTSGKSVLDVGCGSGSSVRFLRQNYHLDAIGIDVSEEMLTKGLALYPDIPIYQGRAEEIHFPDESFAGVLSECTMPHFENPLIVMDEFYRILNRKGWLVLSNLYLRPKDEHWDQLEQCICHQLFMTQQQILKNLRDRNFIVHLWEDHSGLLAQLVCDIIMKYGSIDNFRKVLAEGGIDCQSGLDAGCLAHNLPEGFKLGYYLLIAQKAN